MNINEALQLEGAWLTPESDIVVIGAGHAGCEAALAAARLGQRTALYTMNLDSLANMPCNPNIGGTAKGQLVREIDALGGEIGRVADQTMLQFRMLNASRGPAVLSPRAQIDRRAYSAVMKDILERQERLELIQGEIIQLLTEQSGRNGKERIVGVLTRTHAVKPCRAAIIATGTYLDSRIIIGECIYDGGPDGLFPAKGLTDSMRDLGLPIVRFKTGAPVRINSRTVDYDRMDKQPGDEKITAFSYENENAPLLDVDKQIPCWLSWTSEQTKTVIMDNLDRSPLFSGVIEGVGPRYCPSIEDKYVKFPDKQRHQIFVEPTGGNTSELYVQGLSSSMPEDVQLSMLHSVAGLENAQIMRSAYAIEYDCIDPTCLHLSLETHAVDELFMAGQINGSSGYEEAAAQGIVAGINAARSLNGLDPIIIDRSQGYIGVLIDDLVTKGTQEPYRMMTSRAEYRLLLRQDNADARLTPLGREIGLISDNRWQSYLNKQKQIELETARIEQTRVRPSAEVEAVLAASGSTMIKSGVSLADLLRRPEISYQALAPIDPNRPELPDAVIYAVEVAVKYEGYIKLEAGRIDKFRRNELKLLPPELDYKLVKGLRIEAQQKLERIKPISVGQASRISGVSPADISVLLVYLESRKREKM
ncbi:MAG: tRNA uridine-5-carboxymethylaminomethyl(34) synthesis enzyme MnmG [Clostridiaceae bacterium]|nr:tRNA uridine-5-carboxymethylaminomethyl(34) synthesis enzyme MnmG [Clostridiaceae bacterium]